MRKTSFNVNEIEPGILPLVLALNTTGLVETFSSCEGHFGEPVRYQSRERADVRMSRLPTVTESELESFFHFILIDFMKSDTKWQAVLMIRKEYLATSEAGKPLESFYVFEVVPFEQSESARKKRKHVDTLLQEITAAVERYVSKGRSSFTAPRDGPSPESTSRAQRRRK